MTILKWTYGIQIIILNLRKKFHGVGLFLYINFSYSQCRNSILYLRKKKCLLEGEIPTTDEECFTGLNINSDIICSRPPVCITAGNSITGDSVCCSGSTDVNGTCQINFAP